ncbi:hypothetical protein ACUNV4_29390 [Granulosicoccus sp. 3-233]|uniref:hypothetical protein n=1 Tax=Granulosicoccus sp. 3-233 TaxID=3417969 RepID=UPI003D342B9B
MLIVLFQTVAFILVALLALAAIRALWMTIEFTIGPVNPLKKSPQSTEIGGAFATYDSRDMTDAEYCQKTHQHEIDRKAMAYERAEIEFSMEIEHRKRMRQIAGEAHRVKEPTQSHTPHVVGSSTTASAKKPKKTREAKNGEARAPYQRITKPTSEHLKRLETLKQQRKRTTKAGEVTRIRLH